MAAAVNIASIRGLLCTVVPKTTLVVAPDVYDQIKSGQPLEEAAIQAVKRGVQIRRGPETMEQGTVMVMYSTQIPAPQDWAGKFLNKAGPVPPGILGPYETKVAGQKPLESPVAPPAPRPPAAPRPPSSPKPRPRQRIVDT